MHQVYAGSGRPLGDSHPMTALDFSKPSRSFRVVCMQRSPQALRGRLLGRFRSITGPWLPPCEPGRIVGFGKCDDVFVGAGYIMYICIHIWEFPEIRGTNIDPK